MSLRSVTETYLPALIVGGGALFGYGALSNDVETLKSGVGGAQQTAVAVARLEEKQTATKEVVDKLDKKVDEVLAELRKKD